MAPFRVLIVDSDPGLSRKLSDYLGGRGFETVPCGDVSAASMAMQMIQPDAILIDTALPDGGALDLCFAARQLPSKPWILLLISAKTDPGSLVLLDFDARIDKPFKGKAMRELLEKARRSRSDDTVQDAPKERSRPRARDKDRAALKTLMQNAGTLALTPFPALLYKLFANQSTGALSIFGEMGERMIFFLKGEPVYAASNAAKDSLGAVLVKFGYLEMGALNKALEQRKEGQPLGQVLAERGMISAERLLEALERQTYERILGCFAFSKGTYIFESDPSMLDNVRHFTQNPIQLIVDGVHRFVGPNILANHLQPHLSQYVVRTEKFEAFEAHFPNTAWRTEVMASIDGSETLQKLTSDHGRDIMGLLRLVWSLKMADMVDFLDAPRTWAQRSPDKPPVPSKLPTLKNVDREVLERALEQARVSQVELEAIPRADAKVAERESLTKIILDYTMKLGRDDHWALLGIGREATSKEARAALRASMSKIPPEKFDLLPEKVRKQAIEVRAALKRAFQTINEPRARQRYTDQLELRREAIEAERQRLKKKRAEEAAAREKPAEIPKGEPEKVIDAWASPKRPDRRPTPAWEANNPPTAEDPDKEASWSKASLKLRKARQAIARQHFKEAYRALKTLVAAEEQNHEANVLLAWVVYNLPHGDKARQYKVCRSRIELELTLDGCLPEAYYFLGRMAEDQGEMVSAFKQYRATLTLDKQHADARIRADHLKKHPALQAPPPEESETGVLGRLKDLFKI